MDSTILLEKKELRKIVKGLKAIQSIDLFYKSSEVIMSKLESLPQFKQSKTVLAYWSFDNEVFTHDHVIKWAQNKKIILPSISGDQMNLKEFKGMDQLVEGDLYAIPEPKGDYFDNIEEIDFIVVPGIAFDRNNNRMGRGKAYYDRFLASTDAYKAGICFNYQLFDEVPTDRYDIKMDCVITD